MGLIISIDGVSVSGLLDAVVTSTNYFSSDTFSLTFAMGATPLTDLASWSELPSAYVEVSYMDASAPFAANIITGAIDLVSADPILNTVSIEGRDLSASLIDSILQRDFVNQTASEIVQTLASQHGLASQVTATSGNVGRYFGDGYTKLSLGQFSTLRSNWDLVVQLAREANFDVFVDGTTLIFQPVDAAFNPVVPISEADVIGMRVERTLAIDPSATVQVQSWNSQKMAAYGTTTSEAGGSSPSAPGGGTGSAAYLFSRSNLIPVQADLLAQRYGSEIQRLRTVLHLDMLWDFRISARSILAIQGTASSFDGLYQVDCLERHFSSTSGSSQAIRAVSWPLPD